MNRLLYTLLLALSISNLSFSQCFSKNWSGYGLDHMNIYVMGATLNGESLENGDIVGVFDGSNCVGTGTYSGSMLSISASKDDPVTPAVDGYISGHSISFRMCDFSSGLEVTDIGVTVSGGTLIFEVSGSVFVTLAGTLSCTNPAPPVINSYTQPNCMTSTGSVQLGGLPATGTWTINPGSIIGAGSTTTVIDLVAGTYAWTVTNSMGCTSDLSQTVIINPQPQPPAQPGTISGSTIVCQNTSQTYSVSPVSGATSYTWSLPSGWTGNSTTNSITVTTDNTGGDISVTASNECGTSAARTLGVTVTTVPSQPGTITGDAIVCQGTSEIYSIDPVSGATSYTWTLPGGWSGNSTSASISATVGAAGGNIMVAAINSCGSGTARSLAVTVNTAPAQPASLSGNASVCQGTLMTYIAAEVSGATSYSWTIPSGWTGSSTSSSIDVTIGATGGTISVAAVNACGTGISRSLAVTVSTTPSQPGGISGKDNVCTGTSETYSVAPVSGATSYSWTLPTGWTGTSTTNSITATTTAMGGIISVTASNNCGTSAATTFTVGTRNAPPQPGNITGDATVCQGASESYSINAVSGATSYTWTLPQGWTGSSASASITATVGASSGDISVAATNVCGSSIPKTLAITVSALPAQPGTITGSAAPCQGTSQTYSVTPVTGATSYTWSLPSEWTGTSSGNSITATAGNSGSISVSANNSCGSGIASMLTVNVQTIPEQPAAINGPASVCQNSSQTYSIPGVSGATSYTWTIPAGWTGSSTSNTISVTTGTSGGDITVTASNTCGTSTSRTLSVTTTTVPAQPGTISGSTNPCQGSSQLYSVESVAGATSYTWSLPSGWTGTSTTNSITVATGANNGNISVTANNSCGAGTIRSLAVAVSPLPAQPGSISGNASVCAGTSQTYSVSAVSGASSYTWTLPAGWTGTSTTSSITATAGAQGTISVAANNTCGSGTTRILPVSVSTVPEQPGSISGNTTVCQGSSQVYSVSAVSGATSYSWTLPAGWTGSSTSSTITVTAGPNGGNIGVTANNACGNSTARTLPATVGSIPSAPLTGTLTQPSCEVSTGSVALSGLPSTGNWTITANPGGITRTGLGIAYTFTGLNPGTFNFTVANNAGCQSSASQNVVLNSVPSAPSAPVLGTITQPACGTATGSIVLSGLPSTGTWTLTRNPGSVTSAGTGTSTTITDLNAGVYSFIVSNASGCASPSTGDVVMNSVTVTPSAPVIGEITQPSCSVSGGSVVLNSLPDGSWTLKQNPEGLEISGSGSTYTVESLAPGTYTYAVFSGNSCSSGNSADVVINGVPSAPEAPVAGTVIQPTCEEGTGSVVLNNLPATGNWTLTRNPGDISTSGTGTSATISDLEPGVYTFTVANDASCSSAASASVEIEAQPEIPAIPVIDSVIQPTCAIATGSIIIKNLPETGTWTLTMNPGTVTITGDRVDTTISDLIPGDYSFILTGPSGCSTNVSLDTTINDQPAAPGVPVISLENGTLHSDATEGNQWYNQNGIIGSANARDYTPTVTGDYYVIVTLSGCSSAPSNSINVIVTGIENPEPGVSLNIYPNPVKNELMVELKNPGQIVQFELVNANGKIIANGEIHDRITIYTSSLQSGIYLLKIKSGDDYVIRKIVKD